MSVIHPPRHIVWSTDRVDLSDPFQRQWYIQQVLTYGRADDIQKLDIEEMESILDDLILPNEVRRCSRSIGNIAMRSGKGILSSLQRLFLHLFPPCRINKTFI